MKNMALFRIFAKITLLFKQVPGPHFQRFVILENFPKNCKINTFYHIYYIYIHYIHYLQKLFIPNFITIFKNPKKCLKSLKIDLPFLRFSETRINRGILKIEKPKSEKNARQNTPFFRGFFDPIFQLFLSKNDTKTAIFEILFSKNAETRINRGIAVFQKYEQPEI